WGDGPVIFNEANAEAYGTIITKRYSKYWNIIWILGGDRPAVYTNRETKLEQNDVPLWRAMARGIENVLGKDAFITYHPAGGEVRTSSFIQGEAWLDMNAFQSGHGSRESDPWRWVKEDLSLKPARPVLDMEPCYEDHPVNPWDGKWTRKSRGYFTAYDVRARIYRGVFAGACGVTYGHHSIWQFLNKSLNPPINVGDTLIEWQQAAKAEAANEMQHLKNLMLSRPYFSRVEDQNIIQSPKGSAYTDLIVATRDEDKSWAFVYLPQSKPVKINLGLISGPSKNVWWYDVRTGKAMTSKQVKGKGVQTFIPPAGGMDWVLVLDDASRNFKAPGDVNK
ncbi:MAG TPA: glycoside hydrolase family 140 protein, partial [Cyclobacteriaceae bacterium]|nr:glycoside hydrolase family 140 protein [Cyclobacteriaceae bacterium]